MSDIVSWVSIFIAVGSLVVSILSLISSHINQRRIVAIEEQRQREMELKALQASLHAEIKKNKRNLYQLYLINSGMAEARNIRVKLDGVPLSEHCSYVELDNLPTQVGPGSKITCLSDITFDCSPPFEIEVEWDDDSGTNRIYRSTLTFP